MSTEKPETRDKNTEYEEAISNLNGVRVIDEHGQVIIEPPIPNDIYIFSDAFGNIFTDKNGIAWGFR